MALALVASLFLLATAASAGARPAGPVAVRIEWEGPPGCGDPATFLAGITARASRVRRADGAEDAVHVEVRLARTGGKVQGQLRLPGEDGKAELRKVEGTSCDEVADALSFTAALALGAPGRRATAPPAERASNVAPATAGAPPSGSPQPGPTPPGPPTSAAVVGPPPAPPAGPSPDAPAAPDPQVAAVAAPVTPPPSVSASSLEDGSGTTTPRTGLVPTIGLGAVAGDIVSPFLSVGAALSARLAWRRGGSPALDPSLGISVLHLRDDVLGASPDVAVRWTAVSIEACPGWGLGGATASVELCAGGAGGWLSAAEQAVTVRRSAARSWWSIGPSLRGRLALGWGGLAVEVDLAAQIPLVHRQFVTSTPEETVGETPTIGATLGVAVSRDL